MNQNLRKIVANRNPREVWITVDEVEKLSPACAEKLKVAGMYKVRASQLVDILDRQEKTSKIINAVKQAKLSKEDIKKLQDTIASK